MCVLLKLISEQKDNFSPETLVLEGVERFELSNHC